MTVPRSAPVTAPLTPPLTARATALQALQDVESGAYVNLSLPARLERSNLERRDRDLVTELVYGVTRMRRACDWVVDSHARGELEPLVRNALRLGVYQLLWLRVPAHAAVSETVDLVPKRARGLVNAVLRAVTRGGTIAWPDRATELSYPDWIVDRLERDLGGDADGALRTMNERPVVTRRPDGYTQDLASQWVAAAVDVPRGAVVADLCAGPGGKATALAAAGAGVVFAGDHTVDRARLVAGNAERLVYPAVATIVADGRRPPIAPGSCARVLVDAPCSGLGVLRRRPDARWRITPADVEDLVVLQRALLDAGAPLVAAGGVLVYSVCTLTAAETSGIDDWLAVAHPGFEPLPALDAPWRPHGRGSLLLPQAADTDGMFLLRLRLGSPGASGDAGGHPEHGAGQSVR